MLKGAVPTWEALVPIARTENVSLTWLLDGRGAPFMVATPTSDEEAAEILDELFAENGWAGHVLCNGDECAIVLTQPGQFDTKSGATIDYTIVEIIGGACGPQAIARLGPRTVKSKCEISVTRDQLRRLKKGRMGNLELIGWRDQPGLLSDCPVVRDIPDGDLTYHETAAPVIDMVREKDEGIALCQNATRLSGSGRSVAEATVKALLKTEGKEWENGY